MESLIKDAVHRISEDNVILTIDALDECSTSEVRDMVVLFDELLYPSSRPSHSGVRVFFSSRHYPHISITNGIEIVLEEQEMHRHDLWCYIQSKARFVEHPDLNVLQSNILRRSSGIFLWVVLVIKILRDEYEDGNAHLLQERLHYIPEKLEGLFQQILRMGNRGDPRFVLCVRWVLIAERPLTMPELYWAIMSRAENDLDLVQRTNPGGPDLGTLKRFVLSSSRGLLEGTQGWEGSIQFIHETVREFFLHCRGFGAESSFSPVSHNDLKFCCMHYIYFAWRTQDVWQKQGPKPLFLDYAIRGVLFHSNEVDSMGICQSEFVSSLPAMD